MRRSQQTLAHGRRQGPQEAQLQFSSRTSMPQGIAAASSSPGCSLSAIPFSSASYFCSAVAPSVYTSTGPLIAIDTIGLQPVLPVRRLAAVPGCRTSDPQVGGSSPEGSSDWVKRLQRSGRTLGADCNESCQLQEAQPHWSASFARWLASATNCQRLKAFLCLFDSICKPGNKGK